MRNKTDSDNLADPLSWRTNCIFTSLNEEVSLKNFKSVFVLFAVASIMIFTACAKKDSDFAARYAKNKLGATAVDGEKTLEASDQAAAQGVEADVVSLQRYWTPSGQPGPRVVMATILVNNQQVPVTTSHVGTEVAEGSLNVGNYRVVFHAMCANETCNPYYAALEVYDNTQNQKMIIQEGVRKYFDVTSSDQKDLYQWFTPNKALPFIVNSNAFDVNGMVGYLNQGSAGSSATTNSGIVL